MHKWRPNRRTLMLSPAAWLVLRPFARTARALADDIKTPRVFMLMSKSQGIYPHAKTELWVPSGEGANMTLPKTLSPFEPVKSHLNFLCGYDLKAMRMGLGKAVDWHHAAPVLFAGGLLAYSDKRGDDNVAPATNESLDWFVAKRWNTTPLNFSPGYAPGKGPYKNGDRISWRREPSGALVHVDPTLSVAEAWNNVFKGIGPAPAVPGGMTDTRAAVEKSILDQTRLDTAALKKVLGAEQGRLLDAHETALRELELKIFGSGDETKPLSAGCTPPEAPGDVPGTQSQADVLRRITQTQDFLLAVMRCGLRPVLGFHLGHMNGNEFLPGQWPGGKDLVQPGTNPQTMLYHTDLWHRDTRTDGGFEWMQNLEQRMMSFLAKVVIGMKDIPAGNSNLLEQSIVLYGTPQSFGHSNENHSFMMAGAGGGKIKTGRVLKTNDMRSRGGGSNWAHNDVLISTLHGLGMSDVKTYGNAEFCKGGVTGFM